MSHLVTPTDLAAAIADHDRRTVVLDVRWRLTAHGVSFDGRAAHEAGHVPGSVWVDLESELSDHSRPSRGRHPQPTTETLQAAARRWGLRSGDAVVVLDDLAGRSAARAWWLLRDAGLTDVRVLDGGLAAWTAAGLPLETGPVSPEPGDVVLGHGHLPVVDADGAATAPADGLLLDARAEERFRGEVEPIDPRAGHIPGARNAPTDGNLDADGRFLAPDLLRARYEALGVRDDEPVVVYCGSGVTASHDALAWAIAGFEPVLYPGSWSEWSNDPARPAETGAGRAPGAPAA